MIVLILSMTLLLLQILAAYGKAVISELPTVNHYSLKLQPLLKEERLEAEVHMRVINETQKTFTEIPSLLYRLLDVQGIVDKLGCQSHWHLAIL